MQFFNIHYMDKIQQFWDWFKINEVKYFFLNQITDEIQKESLLDELLEHLHLYCDKLYFEVGGLPNENQDLIITAGGDSDFFDDVELLVTQAPELEHWNIIAFKPAMAGGLVKYNDIELDPKAMYFDPLESKSSEKIGLRIYVENYESIHNESFLMAANILVDSLIGEKSSAMDIGYIEVASLQSIPDKEELIEFTKLPRYVKWKKSTP